MPEVNCRLAEIISVGDEMTSGHRLDTNSQWISRQLSDVGIATGWHSTVGDDVDRQTGVFRIAARRASIVIVTGGLGPTSDDLTREVMSRLTGCPLVRDNDSLQHIRQIFRGYGREMPESNVVQADLPKGARVILNREGTAPGIDMSYSENPGQSCRFFCLPGVPAEMVSMWESHVCKEILDAFGNGQFLLHKVLNCFGAGESQIESMLPGLIARGRNPQVGITASMATISLRIAASGESRERCFSLVSADEELIRRRLGTLVFGTGEETLEEILIRSLLQFNWKLAVSDAGLAGGVSQLLALADPDGRVLTGATFARLPATTLEQLSELNSELKRASSLESIVSRMAKECAESFSTEIAIAIGPILPARDGRQEFGMAIWSQELCEFELLQHSGHSGLRISRSQKQVLDKLRLFLQKPGLLKR